MFLASVERKLEIKRMNFSLILFVYCWIVSACVTAENKNRGSRWSKEIVEEVVYTKHLRGSSNKSINVINHESLDEKNLRGNRNESIEVMDEMGQVLISESDPKKKCDDDDDEANIPSIAPSNAPTPHPTR